MAAATAFGFLDKTENSSLWLDFLIFIIVLFGCVLSIPGALARFCSSSNACCPSMGPKLWILLCYQRWHAGENMSGVVLSLGTDLQDTSEVLAWLQWH